MVYFIETYKPGDGPVDLGPIELICDTSDTKDSAPIFTMVDDSPDNREYRSNFSLWKSYPLIIDPDELKLGLKMRNGEMTFRVYVEYWFVVHGDNVEFHWRIAKKGAKRMKGEIDSFLENIEIESCTLEYESLERTDDSVEDNDRKVSQRPSGYHTVIDKDFIPEPAPVEEG